MSASDRQPPGPYPAGTPAARPEDVDPYACEHEGNPPVCQCAHDWRINWGNLKRVNKSRATYVTDAP